MVGKKQLESLPESGINIDVFTWLRVFVLIISAGAATQWPWSILPGMLLIVVVDYYSTVVASRRSLQSNLAFSLRLCLYKMLFNSSERETVSRDVEHTFRIISKVWNQSDAQIGVKLCSDTISLLQGAEGASSTEAVEGS
jgi:hypothetical protein